MRWLFAILVSSTVIIIAIAAEPSASSKPQQTIYDRVHKTSELPTGGDFVEHPKKRKLQYYFTNRLRMWKDKTNAQKHSGLYVSEDGGNTWKLRCYFFEFQELFLHPETGKLYCIIDYTWLAKNKEGFLWPHSANKALMSEDGKHWEDITGGNGYIADITGIVADPDNPDRVCLHASIIRPYVLQSEDEAYSKWTWYRVWGWPKRKKKNTSQPTDTPDKR
jgi:hypothetical protein